MPDIVSIRRCADYDKKKVYETMQQCFTDIGGLKQFIQPGMRVLVKPNLLMRRQPEEVTTTHPAVVEAVVRLVMQCGATAVIADSPGGPFNANWLNGIYKTTGMSKIAEDTGCVLSFDVNRQTVSNHNGLKVKELEVISEAAKADVIISVAKLKTHGMLRYTGAVKNMFGIVPGTVKTEYHYRMPNLTDFSNALIDIYLAGKPALAVLDAIDAMEGAGPSGGTKRHCGLLLVSNDGFSLDYCASTIIGLPPEENPLLSHAMARGLCPRNMAEIQFPALLPQQLVIAAFAVPESGGVELLSEKLPKAMQVLLARHMQPYPVFTDRCQGCGVCAQACPPQVITMHDGRPQANLKKCIRCYCCQELCPYKAITVKRPRLARMLGRL